MNEINHKDKQWMELCEAASQIFSTCSKGQVFSVIVDEHQRIVGTGYNGVPSGMTHCVDGGCPRANSNVPSGSTYDSGPGLCLAAHAEVNALAHGDGTRYHKSTLYVNVMPCLGCLRVIAASGIKRVVTNPPSTPIDQDLDPRWNFSGVVRVLNATDGDWLL